MKQWDAQEFERFLVPLGPWKTDSTSPVLHSSRPPHTYHLVLTVSDSERRASELLRQNVYKVCSSWRPGFLNAGYPPDQIDDWIAKSQNEVAHTKVHTYLGVSSHCDMLWVEKY